MKHTTPLALLFAFAAAATAQTTPITVTPSLAQPAPAATFIKGSLNIHFDTLRTPKPVVGTTDKYTFTVNVCNSAKFHGEIDRLPNISGTMGFGGQPGSLTYAVDCDVINPRNPAQSANVGKLLGVVPNDKANVYHFDTGDAPDRLMMDIEGRGNAQGFQSKFGGVALGKPPQGSPSMKQQMLSIMRVVHGQTMTVKVEKYDKMEFRDHVLAAGPVLSYGAVTVNGAMIYDYGRNAWHFKSVHCVYSVKGAAKDDTLTGDIRWVEDPNRKANGLGHYEFDIRVNEPPPSEEAAFTANNASDEASFFTTDASIPSLVGTMDYKDTLQDDPKGGDPITTDSIVQINLQGQGLDRQQVMYLAKLLLFSVTVPLNSD